MSITQFFRCNFCQNGTITPNRWFHVISIPMLYYGNTKPQVSEDEIQEREQLHACTDCGTKLHDWLKTLGIQHEFNIVMPNEEPFRWGRIFIP